MGKRRRRDHWDVLLAEDNDDHALLIERALKRASHVPIEVRRARNGDEAIQMVEDLTPDLILLDLKMPGRNGHEVLAVIKADDEFRRIPVAVLTSSDHDDDVAASYALGGNHFITKPETPEELEHSLSRLLTNMEELSRVSRGSGLLATTGVSAVDAGGVALRQFLMWAGVVGTIGFLGAFAYFMGVL